MKTHTEARFYRWETLIPGPINEWRRILAQLGGRSFKQKLRENLRDLELMGRKEISGTQAKDVVNFTARQTEWYFCPPVMGRRKFKRVVNDCGDRFCLSCGTTKPRAEFIRRIIPDLKIKSTAKNAPRLQAWLDKELARLRSQPSLQGKAINYRTRVYATCNECNRKKLDALRLPLRVKAKRDPWTMRRLERLRRPFERMKKTSALLLYGREKRDAKLDKPWRPGLTPAEVRQHRTDPVVYDYLRLRLQAAKDALVTLDWSVYDKAKHGPLPPPEMWTDMIPPLTRRHLTNLYRAADWGVQFRGPDKYGHD